MAANGSFAGQPLFVAGTTPKENCTSGGQAVILGCQAYMLMTGSHLFVDASPVTGTAGQGYASFYAAAVMQGPADHFNGYQARQTAASGANISSWMTGYESQQEVKDGATVANVFDFHAIQSVGTGKVTNHYGLFCDVFSTATDKNLCVYAPYGSGWFGKVIDLAAETGGDIGVGARLHKGASVAYFDPSDKLANTTFTDQHGVLVINGQNGGVVAIHAGSYAAFCPPGVDSYSCNAGAYIYTGASPGPSYHEALYTPASSRDKCNQGDFADDASYHYVCVAQNTWRRVALTDF